VTAPRTLLRAALAGLLALHCAPKAPSGPLPPSPPAAIAASPYEPPTPEVRQTPGGLELWAVRRADLPLVSLRFVIDGGARLDPAAHPGLTSLADALLLRGAGERDAAAFSTAAQLEAIHLGVWTSRTATVVEVGCTADRLDAALALVADALMRPRFDADEVKRQLDQRVAELKEARDDPRSVAADLGWAAWFGEGHPYASPVNGTVAGLSPLAGPDPLRASWTARVGAARPRVIAVGDLDPEALGLQLDALLAAWPAPTAAAPALPPAAEHAGLLMVDQPGASQTVLRVISPGWRPDDPVALAAELGVFVLGGSFTSRLNRVLREEKGYTYGARSALTSGPGWGTVVTSTNVFAAQTGPALADLRAILTQARDGIDAAELTKAQQGLRTSAIESAGSRDALADDLVGLMLDRLPPTHRKVLMGQIPSVPEAEVDRALGRLDLDRSLVVVVGDLAKIRADVEAAWPGAWTVHTP
jgi:zinc protease